MRRQPIFSRGGEDVKSILALRKWEVGQAGAEAWCQRFVHHVVLLLAKCVYRACRSAPGRLRYSATSPFQRSERITTAPVATSNHKRAVPRLRRRFFGPGHLSLYAVPWQYPSKNTLPAPTLLDYLVAGSFLFLCSQSNGSE